MGGGPPPSNRPRRVVVEADGGSRSNPGVAGYGAVVRDADSGVVLVELAAPLGRASNNVAEYQGLIAGLQAAAMLAPGIDVEVRMDSRLVIEQMAGNWRVRHPDLQTLAGAARDMATRLGEVRWTWVPRDQNTVADRLSNVGMDGRRVDTLPQALAAFSEGTPHPRDEDAAEPAPAALVPTARVVLVRHAVTPFTEQGRVDGRGGADPDLSDAGREQAARAAGAVAALAEEWVEDEVRLVTSSLARTRQTGAAIATALGVEPVLDDDWDEQSFGDWDGAIFTELVHQQGDDLNRLWRDREYRRPGGESLAELETRVLRAYERVVAGGTAVVVTSRKPILVVLAHVLGISGERFWALSTDPASMTEIEVWPDGRMSVPFVNRTSHLAGNRPL